MVGRIYRVALTGQYDELPHPFVVVIEFSGARDCLVVPAFSAGGFRVNELIEVYLRQGYREDQVAARLDNTQHVTFTTAHSGKEALWLTARFARLSVTVLNASPCIGQMDTIGLRAIAESLLAMAETKAELFSPAVVKKLRQICSQG